MCAQAVGFVEKYLVTIELIGSCWLYQNTLPSYTLCSSNPSDCFLFIRSR